MHHIKLSAEQIAFDRAMGEYDDEAEAEAWEAELDRRAEAEREEQLLYGGNDE